jgi:NADH:ubiquinone oxidoreductase subunit H
MISVAFFTLAERKLIAVNHLRTGPNKARAKGILQPFRDALKLISKEWTKIKIRRKAIFTLRPFLGILSYTMIWIIVPNPTVLRSIKLSVLFLTALISTTVVFSIRAGWASNRKYTLLGSYRSTAQAISYEISMAILVLGTVIFLNRLNLSYIKEIDVTTRLIFLPFITAWIITVLAETSRTPFDFTESESELVSGFNTEYYGMLFSVFFIAEYIALIFISILTATLFITRKRALPTVSTVVLAIITTIRITLPRSRYDKLITLAWLVIIPTSLFALIVSVILK